MVKKLIRKIILWAFGETQEAKKQEIHKTLYEWLNGPEE